MFAVPHLSNLIITGLLTTLVAAHGNVIALSAGSIYQNDNTPYTLRRVTTNVAIVNTSNPDIICNTNGNIPIIDAPVAMDNNSPATPASAFSTVSAGDNFTFSWTDCHEFGSHHGPIIAYLGECDGDCTSFDPWGKAIWFKIAQGGFEKIGTLENGNPYPIMGGARMGLNGNKWTVTLPQGLKQGHYLLRVEVLALHLASTEYGAQFYPACQQLFIQSNDTMVPDTSLVAWPGAYSSKDPGVLIEIGNLKDGDTYVVPGPDVATYKRDAAAYAQLQSSKSHSVRPLALSTQSVPTSANGMGQPTHQVLPSPATLSQSVDATSQCVPADPVADLRLSQKSDAGLVVSTCSRQYTQILYTFMSVSVLVLAMLI